MATLEEQIAETRLLIRHGENEERAARRVLGYSDGPLNTRETISVGDLRVAVANSIAGTVTSTNPPKQKEEVNHPDHYNMYKGIEIIDLVEQMPFNTGNAVKYITRAPFKGREMQDLEKARWYIDREIERLKNVSYETFTLEHDNLMSISDKTGLDFAYLSGLYTIYQHSGTPCRVTVRREAVANTELKPDKTIDYRVGARISLDDLRTIVAQTQGADGMSAVQVLEEAGQRDAVYYHVVIKEP